MPEMSAWLLLPGFSNQFVQPVGGTQQYADPVRRENHLTGADQRQHVFRLVRQLADLHQIENARSSFDRMHGPKDTIYQFLIDLRSALFDGKKVRLNGGQVLAALGQVLLSQLVVKIDHRPDSSKPVSSFGLDPSGPLQSALEPLEFLDRAGQKLTAAVQLSGEPRPVPSREPSRAGLPPPPWPPLP